MVTKPGWFIRNLGIALVTCVLAVSLSATHALALPMVDFAGFTPGGTIENVGGFYVGTNIPIDLLVANNTLNDGMFPVIGGRLDFTTDMSTTNFSIQGAIPTLGINDSTFLLVGDLQDFTISQNNTVFSSSGVDEKNPRLLAALGLSSNGGFSFSHSSVGTNNQGVIDVASTNVLNRGGTAIPEPASILLLGSGMIGLGAWQWHRNRRNKKAA